MGRLLSDVDRCRPIDEWIGQLERRCLDIPGYEEKLIELIKDHPLYQPHLDSQMDWELIFPLRSSSGRDGVPSWWPGVLYSKGLDQRGHRRRFIEWYALSLPPSAFHALASCDEEQRDRYLVNRMFDLYCGYLEYREDHEETGSGGWMAQDWIEHEAPISREDAARIAQAHWPDKELREVEAYDELNCGLSISLCGDDIRNCWVAYFNRWPGGECRGLFSSLVVLVSTATGNVLYTGSAGDEG